ncbi:NCS2 family permease [Anaerocolumna aminovalerica]|uniref:Putative MFS transporter, AGZA family, xanthine/uracil permease n=1 Tax=Anaerocolumna aminovalerica TaxID=1527 RepID=A0A1I5HD06_9FIRM|nr:NCS2 family permease [Anaerocolumna aminovalerica]SFO46069.1 putative MFS transporter, AGZA family, xanthine/uracil permease [Anaerocolumna aminovalerica]
MEKFFKLKENKTDVKTEVLAGITTFMTMAYILAVNPSTMTAFNDILGLEGSARMNPNGVFMATAISAFIGSLLMALLANYPFALAPGMGLNAYFAYTVVLKMGYPWQVALTAVFVEGIIFILLSLTSVREAIFNSIPTTLKFAVSSGIGLFIAFIGLQNGGIVESNGATLVQFHAFHGEGISQTANVSVILAILGVIITGILLIKKVKGGILFGILITWILGVICQLTGLYVVDPAAGFFSLLPSFSSGFDFAALGDVAFKLDFSGIFSLDFIVVMFAFLFVDMFDTLGTLIGVSAKADMLDKDGKLPRIKGALLADAIGTVGGSLLGTSTVTTYVESATGVSEGGRTGLTALTTAILFGLSVFLSPIFLAIPAFATAPALIIVGFYMMGSIAHIDFEDMSEAIPAFICIIAMPFTYSISEGISFGVISYVLVNLFTGKAKEKKISSVMYVLTVLFILKYVLL